MLKMVETDQEGQCSLEDMKSGAKAYKEGIGCAQHYGVHEPEAARDVLEDRVYATLYLTRADIDRTYRLLRGCSARAAAKCMLLPEPESDTPSAPTTGHALNMDIFSTDTPRC